MKFLHISDLHIGKYVNGYRMLDDQRYMLERIIEIIKEKNPDALLIAGDIYDKAVPAAEAVEVFDHFINELQQFGRTKTQIVFSTSVEQREVPVVMEEK